MCNSKIDPWRRVLLQMIMRAKHKTSQTNVLSLFIKVIPNSSRNSVIGFYSNEKSEQVLKIKVSAPAEKGKANKAVLQLLKKVFLELGEVSKITFISGQKDYFKRIHVEL